MGVWSKRSNSIFIKVTFGMEVKVFPTSNPGDGTYMHAMIDPILKMSELIGRKATFV